MTENRTKGVVHTKKHVLIGLAVALVLGVACVAAAAPSTVRFGGFGGLGAGKFFGGPTGPGANLVNDLGLSDDQLARIREIEADCLKKTQELRSALEQKMFELRSLYLQKDPDEDAIEAKRTEIADLQKQIRTIQQETWEQIKGVYTQEQLDKLNEMRPAGFGRGRGRGGPGRGTGPGGLDGLAPEPPNDGSTLTPGAEGTVAN